jgi:hypothetical protein
MPYDENTNTHAMCGFYGHEWRKHDLLSAKQGKGYRVEVCARNGCDAARRVYNG